MENFNYLIDTLDQMSDEELRYNDFVLMGAIKKTRDYHLRKNLEINLCYVQRELDIRARRAIAAEHFNAALMASSCVNGAPPHQKEDEQ